MYFLQSFLAIFIDQKPKYNSNNIKIPKNKNNQEEILRLKDVIKSAFYAFLFVSPLYAVWLFELILKIDIPLALNSILGLLSLAIFLYIPTRYKFKFGFLVGLFWFYWIGFSFVYFGFGYLIPLISIIVALIYMLLFALALASPNLLYRGFWLLIMSLIHPFGFDWMKIDSFFAYSYFGVGKESFFLIIMAMIFFKLAWDYLKGFFALGVLFLCFALDFRIHTPPSLPFKIDLLHTNFPQDFKWQKENTQKNSRYLLSVIFSSIQQGNQIIVLPETAFPFLLEHSHYFDTLKKMSLQSTLVVGAVRKVDSKLYNSSYIFQNGEVQIFNKVILAPFGEKIPLPDFLAKPLNRIFLGDHAPQFTSSEEFGIFTFNEIPIKSAICYEGTREEAYKQPTPFLIVISNNAWFPHTIEPALQKNLMKYYARLYQTTILHSSNGSPSFIIFP